MNTLSQLASQLVIFTTLLFCVAVLIISIYPGAIDSLLFAVTLVSIVSVPMFVVVGIMVLVVLGRRGKLRSIKIPPRIIVAITGILLISYILLKFYIPRRLGFMVSQSAFEQVRVQLPVSRTGKIALNRKLGFYEVDEYANDSRGGVYFRVFSGGSGLGPDVTSYGFAYRPNREGSPFGAADYQVFYLSGDWYWFRVSDDFW
jgi:amino acid transporter